jgi:hypothetical protein
VLETHDEHIGRFQRSGEFFLASTSHLPLKPNSMIALLSGDCEGRERIRRKNSVHISLGLLAIH